jgi:hypothetical protein
MSESCKLTKLYIEGEHICGDRGIVILFKHLQYNNSLLDLTIRDCGLGTRCAFRYWTIALLSLFVFCAGVHMHVLAIYL